MQRAWLTKVADFLDMLPRKKFDIGQWHKETDKCGTVACAFGWCPILFKRSALKYVKEENGKGWNADISYTNKNGTHYDLDAAMEFFGLEHKEAFALFIGQSYPEYTEKDKDGYTKGHKGITPKRVARRIRHFVKTGEIK